jgi:hypothetical protein
MQKVQLIKIFTIFLALVAVETKYEIIMDRQEAALGENDLIFSNNFTARIRKYNRTS